MQALQNFGHVVPFSTLLAAFASFHSTAHFFCRSRAASCPVLGSFLDFAVLSDAGACCCAAAVDTNPGIGAVIIPTASAGTKDDFKHEFTSLYFNGAAPAGRQSASVRNLKSR